MDEALCLGALIASLDQSARIDRMVFSRRLNFLNFQLS
jgi:hypothetical protein